MFDDKCAGGLAAELAKELAGAEDAYRTAVMNLVGRADDVMPLARVAEHLANMCAAVGHAAGAALERVDLFESVAVAGYAAAHNARYTDVLDGAEDAADAENAGDDGGGGAAGRASRNLGAASLHLEHLKALLEAAETMGGHATAHLAGPAGLNTTLD